jgi:hypothetical protein
MPLPHFTTVTSHGGTFDGSTIPSSMDEPVYPSLFEVIFTLPVPIQNQGYPSGVTNGLLLLENATAISGIAVHKDLSTANQRFKYSTRMFLTMPADTSLDNVQISFNVNVREQGDVQVYNALRAWYDLAWNSQNGSLHYKRDMVGTIVINHHDRKGYIIRRLTLNNCQLKNISGYLDSVDWNQNTEIIQKIDANFVVDYWNDERVDIDSSYNGDFANGYSG